MSATIVSAARRRAWLGIVILSLLGPISAPAQEGDELLLEALEEADPALSLTGDPRLDAALIALDAGRFIRARELTAEVLAADPNSYAGHCLLGMIHHRGEGNLPLALYHLKRSRRLFEERHGRVPIDDGIVIFWHAQAIAELATVSGAMGRHADKVRYLREHDLLYEPGLPAQRSWPLMRLRRYQEARWAALEGLQQTDQPDQIAIAHTALCAIEAEQQHRLGAWEACLAAAEHERLSATPGPVPFTNAAESALSMLRFDTAEQFILEGSEHFVAGTVANPWLDLMLLYLAEGRIGEALDAVRRMIAWRHRQPAVIDEQNRAETELAAALFLLAAGRPEAAARITARVLDRPDRTGYTSSESEQLEAANALVDSLAQRVAAERRAEEASYAELWDAAAARFEALRRRLRAWSSGRRAAALLADERILVATVRPYLAGSIEVPEWIAPEVAAILGPGVVAAAVRTARAEETLPAAGGYFRAWEAELARRRGRDREALERADQALAELPESEVLLRARVAALGADAAWRAGLRSRTSELFDRAMQLDPGVVRRLGLALPTAFEPARGPIAEAVRDYLRGSPRLAEAAFGFRVRSEGLHDAGQACLLGPQGTVLACAQVTPRAGEATADVARRLAREFHDAAFAPRVDLTQADLRSLDGSPTAGGGRSRERLRTVLSELVDEDEK